MGTIQWVFNKRWWHDIKMHCYKIQPLNNFIKQDIHDNYARLVELIRQQHTTVYIKDLVSPDEHSRLAGELHYTMK